MAKSEREKWRLVREAQMLHEIDKMRQDVRLMKRCTLKLEAEIDQKLAQYRDRDSFGRFDAQT